MSRTRLLRPKIAELLSRGTVPIGARLLYYALLPIADDEGRLIGNHRYIANRVFPNDPDILDKLPAWLSSLENDLRLIHRYHVGGVNYIEITDWHTQRVAHPTPSSLPAPAQQNDLFDEVALARAKRGEP